MNSQNINVGTLLVAHPRLSQEEGEFGGCVFLVTRNDANGIVGVNVAKLRRGAWGKPNIYWGGPLYEDAPPLLLVEDPSGSDDAIGATGYALIPLAGRKLLLALLKTMLWQWCRDNQSTPMILVGCVTWKVEQLKDELGKGRWCVTDMSLGDLLRLPVSERWRSVAGKISFPQMT